MNYYLSTGAFLTRNLREILDLADCHGFNLELGAAVQAADENEDLLVSCQRGKHFLVHNYFPPPAIPFVLNLASTDEDERRKSRTLCRIAVDLCATLGAPFYSVHAGFAMLLQPEELGDPFAQRQLSPCRTIPRPEAYRHFIQEIRLLADYAGHRGVGLLVENNVAARENFDAAGESTLLLAQPEELAGFFAEVEDVGVRLLLDVGHAKVTARATGQNPVRFFECLAPYIEALHLSDNDGERDTNGPFDSGAWFAPYLSGFAGKKMVVEVYRQPVAILQAQLRQLAEMVE
jgi:sugar phosphate isomerase/epimerase